MSAELVEWWNRPTDSPYFPYPYTYTYKHRDMFGAPDVLIRKDKDFVGSYTGVPSATDDDLAPGAG